MIKYKSFSDSRYYSRYDFLKKHYRCGNVLDIGNIGGVGGDGSGRSSYLRFLAECGEENKIYGFDLYTPKDSRLYQLQKRGDVEDGLPYENNFFDSVYIGELIEHLANFEIVFCEIRRVLKNDGLLILDTPNLFSTLRIIRYLFKREENLGDPTHLIFFSPASLQSTLRKFGFSIEEMATDISSKLKFLPMYFIKGLGSHILVAAKKIDGVS